MQGQVIASQAAFALSTTESVDLIIPTYQYLQPGTVRTYAKASAATVLLNLFIAGTQVLRRAPVLFTGTAGTIDTSANLISEVNTLFGGRIECTAVATTGTPTIDLLITHAGVPMVGAALGAVGRLLGRGR